LIEVASTFRRVNTINDSTKAIRMLKEEIQPMSFSGILLPSKPEIINPASGMSNIKSKFCISLSIYP
jgi:hypothetical protein